MEPQSNLGYGCECGFKTLDRKEFSIHLRSAGHFEPGVHHSLGRIDMETGEVKIPPWRKRTKEEKAETSLSKRKETQKEVYKATEALAEATALKFVPRAFTVDLSPLLVTARMAATREWSWREDMPFINFLDTVIFNYFFEHGIELGGYVVRRDGEQPAVVQ